MSDDLKADLQDIDGVGEATAEKILDVLADHGVGERSRYLEKALDAADAGNDREAALYLRRAEEE